jgi:cobyrinic acid a,c-diamide synthase
VPEYIQRLGDLVGSYTDLQLLLQLAATAAVPPPLAANSTAGAAGLETLQLPNSSNSSSRCRIAVARDEAFCFYYHDNLALLTAAGAELVYFSPLHDSCLPPGISGVYLGGGYPERHLQQLSSNNNMLRQVLGFAEAGGVVYAECGGLIYLSRGVLQQQPQVDGSSSSSKASEQQEQQQQLGKHAHNSSSSSSSRSDKQHEQLSPLAGVLPFATRMGGMKMGYVEVQVLHNNPIFPAGVTARGQMYHFSEVVEDPAAAAAAAVDSNDTAAPQVSAKQQGSQGLGSVVGASLASSSSSSGLQRSYQLLQVLPGAVPVHEGYTVGNVLASYVHLHFGGCPGLAAALVDKCCSSSIATAEDGSVTAAAGSAGAAAAAADQPACLCCSSSCAAANCKSSNAAQTGNVSSSSRNDKIVSLLPSGTEILYALGLGPRVVGVSGFCDYPAEARGKPVAVRSLINVDAMTSDEVEQAMQVSGTVSWLNRLFCHQKSDIS